MVEGKDKGRGFRSWRQLMRAFHPDAVPHQRATRATFPVKETYDAQNKFLNDSVMNVVTTLATVSISAIT